MSLRAGTALRSVRVRLPIRLKLAVVSAALTFVILLLFALIVGAFTDRRLESSFDDDLRATAADLQEEIRIEVNFADQAVFVGDPDGLDAAAAGGAVIRVVNRAGEPLSPVGGRTPDLGDPFEGVREVSNYRVVSRPLFADSLDPRGAFNLDTSPADGAVAYVQYGKPAGSLQSTSDRLHLFLALGVLGGTALAFLAGFAVARRAMQPIAGLTRAAREVARTRDPAKKLPRPESRDEVAELAATLEEMLRQLDAAHGETEAALQRQRAFVADASHELRTPLTSILANLELLEEELTQGDGALDRAAAADVAGSALRSSRRMRRLVGDLLLLARADAGREVPRAPVDLRVVVAEAAAEAAPLASGHHVAVDVPDAGEPVIVEGVADDLHRLVLNLVENAFLHTPPGTPIVASARREGDRAVLEVADRGPGVPTDQRGRIFERFGHSTATGSSAGGSGLGLAIVRAVAEAHGGTVEVRDAEGGGAVFAVALPVEPEGQSPTAAPQTSTTTGSTIGRRLSRR